MLACDADGLADILTALLEDAERALADIFGCDTRELLVIHRQRECQRPVRPFLRTHAEVNQIVPIERRAQKGRGHAELRKLSIGLALAVEVRYLILPH